jgi:hypothetical protein
MRIAVDKRDAFTALGLILIGGGLAQISLAAALAVPGALIFLLAVAPLLRSGR